MSGSLHADDAKRTPTLIVEQDMANMLIETAKKGIVPIGDNAVASSAVLLAGLAKDNFDGSMDHFGSLDLSIGSASQAELIVINGLDVPLTLKTNSFVGGSCTGFQTYYPSDKSSGDWAHGDVIPARGTGDSVAAGVGIFRFEGNTSIFYAHSISGALEFTAPGLSDSVAIAFFVPRDQGGAIAVNVTARLSNYKTNEGFFGQLDKDTQKQTDHSTNTGVKVFGSITTRTGVFVGNADELKNMIVTFAVMPA